MPSRYAPKGADRVGRDIPMAIAGAPAYLEDHPVARKPFGEDPVHSLNARRKLFGSLYPNMAAMRSTGMSEFRSISRACSSMNMDRIVLYDVPSAPRAL